MRIAISITSVFHMQPAIGLETTGFIILRSSVGSTGVMDWTVFLAPMTTEAWLLLIVVCAGCACIMSLFSNAG